MKKEISKITFRKDLYPRFEPDQKKIQEYSENIEKLPPIVINQDNIKAKNQKRCLNKQE